MKKLIRLLAVAFSIISLDVRANTPTPVVMGTTLTWPEVAARSINVHRGDGTYLMSLVGHATSWTATESGNYYLVATQDGPWQGWPRSATVAVTINTAGVPMPTVDGSTLSWPAVTAVGINLHRGDGSYVTSLPGDSTSWTAPMSGSYYLVATNSGDWTSWRRSELVTVEDTHNSAVPNPVVEGNQLVWDSVSAEVINIHTEDGSYIESLPGNATSWTASQSGTYYLVAVDSSNWINWPRSSAVSILVVPEEKPFSLPDPAGATVVARLGFPVARDSVNRMVSGSYLNIYFDIEADILTGSLHSGTESSTLDCPGGGTVMCVSDGCIYPLSVLQYDNCVVEGRVLSGIVERRGNSFPFASGGSSSITEMFDNFSINAGSADSVLVTGSVKRTVVDSQFDSGVTLEINKSRLVEAMISEARLETPAGVSNIAGSYTESSVDKTLVHADNSTSRSSTLSFEGEAFIESSELGATDISVSKSGELVSGESESTGVPAQLSADFGDTSAFLLTASADAGDSVQVDIVSESAAVSFTDVYQFESGIRSLE